MLTGWHRVDNSAEIDSPALLFYHDRIVENIRRTVELAGGTVNLRPHLKTHKSADVLRLQMAAGISKFKCATVAEAEMAAQAGAGDVLLAYQPVGPRAKRFAKLVEQFGAKTKFSCIVDNEQTMLQLAGQASAHTGPLRVLLDLDCGMARTGVPPGPAALELYRQICAEPRLEACGLHVYDGHIHDTDSNLRAQRCEAAFAPVQTLRDELIRGRMAVPVIVAGGTPTFPFHARRSGVECSPGTNVFWDAGYSKAFPDLDFLHAALMLARVVSKPGGKRVCLDLGHKAIASEGPHPRVIFPALLHAEVVMHSEEHLVVEAQNADELQPGTELYGIPWHICPTVALHRDVVVIKKGKACEHWKISNQRMLNSEL